jgi:hypothetical protein
MADREIVFVVNKGMRRSLLLLPPAISLVLLGVAMWVMGIGLVLFVLPIGLGLLLVWALLRLLAPALARWVLRVDDNNLLTVECNGSTRSFLLASRGATECIEASSLDVSAVRRLALAVADRFMPLVVDSQLRFELCDGRRAFLLNAGDLAVLPPADKVRLARFVSQGRAKDYDFEGRGAGLMETMDAGGLVVWVGSAALALLSVGLILYSMVKRL